VQGLRKKVNKTEAKENELREASGNLLWAVEYHLVIYTPGKNDLLE